MHRAHLIVNPRARLVTPQLTSAVAGVLARGLALDVSETTPQRSGSATAREAVERGADLVVGFGGDGLVNEIVNGLVGTSAMLGVVPGGTMNVFARDLGLPRRPMEAARHLAGRDPRRPPLRVDLGRANGRYFTFACGCGFDAEVAQRVNRNERAKHSLGETFFYAAALATLARSYAVRAPFLEIEGDFGRRSGVLAVALVGRPYAYLGGRAVRLGTPSPTEGLSLLVVHDLRLWRVPAYAAAAILNGRLGTGWELLADIGWVEVRSGSGIPVHVDGERMASEPAVVVEFAEAALTVVA